MRAFEVSRYREKGLAYEPSKIWGTVIRAYLENLPGFGGTFVYLEDSLSGEPSKDLGYLKYLEKGLSSFHFMI